MQDTNYVKREGHLPAEGQNGPSYICRDQKCASSITVGESWTRSGGEV
jgi:hypothetical protein